MKRMHPHLLEFNDEPDLDQDQEMTSDVDEDATSDVEEDGTEATNGPSKDEQALLDFSSQPTDHSSSQTDLDNILTAYPHQMQFQTEQPISENTTSIEEEHTFRYDTPLARSQSAPASDHIPSSPNNSRSISVPLGDSIPESAASSVVADVASLLFDSSSSGSQSATSSQTSYTTFVNDTSKNNTNSNKSRYPFPYNAPPLHHRSLQRSNNSDGENESTSTVSRRNPAERKTTSSAEDLFDLLYAPTPIKTSSTMAYHHNNGYMTPMKNEFVRNIPKTAPPLHQFSQHHQHPLTQQQRQPLMRVPSFGTPWAPGSPSKGQSQQLFRDVGDMFT